MLQLIFQGFVEWSYGLTLESWQYFSSALLDVMSLDFQYLKTHIPVIDDIILLLVAVGWALLIGNLAFQALKSMASGLGFEGEDPKFLFARSFVFGFLLLASPEICEIGLTITSNVISLLQVPSAINVTFLDAAAFSPLNASWLIVIIFDVILMFKVFQMILEMAERYVILAMLTITAPLAFAMGGSRATSEIFTGWCRMYGSMCLLMVTHVIFFKMLLSVVSTVPSGIDVLPWMILILAIVKVARKADAIVTRIGLNPAITGDSLGLRIPGFLSYVVARAVTKNAGAAFGKMFGNPVKGGGWNGFQPFGMGGQQWTGSRGNASYSSYATANHTASETKANVAQQQVGGITSPEQASTMQQTSVSAETIPVASAERTAGTIPTSRTEPDGGLNATRVTAVPLGMRRAPGHIRPAETGKTPERGTQGQQGAVSEKPSATIRTVHEQPVQPGTAGTSAPVESTRITRAGKDVLRTSQHGAATSMQHNVVSQQHEETGAIGIQPGTAATTPLTRGEIQQTRITRRTSQTQVQHGAVIDGSVQTVNVQPGTAGTMQQPAGGAAQNRMPLTSAGGVQYTPGSARMSDRPAGDSGKETVIHKEAAPSARPGRNIPPVQSVLSGERQTSSPARQELRQTSREQTIPAGGKATVTHRGAAGTAQGLRPGQQTRQSARDRKTEDSSRGLAGHSVPKSSIERPIPKNGGKQDVKPTRRTRGAGHGR